MTSGRDQLVGFPAVLGFGENLQIPDDMQATHGLASQGNDVIDMVLNACVSRQPLGLLLNRAHIFCVCPRWHRTHASGATPSVIDAHSIWMSAFPFTESLIASVNSLLVALLKFIAAIFSCQIFVRSSQLLGRVYRICLFTPRPRSQPSRFNIGVIPGVLNSQLLGFMEFVVRLQIPCHVFTTVCALFVCGLAFGLISLSVGAALLAVCFPIALIRLSASSLAFFWRHSHGPILSKS